MERLTGGPLVPSSGNPGNTTADDPALAMTAPGSPSVGWSVPAAGRAGYCPCGHRFDCDFVHRELRSAAHEVPVACGCVPRPVRPVPRRRSTAAY